MSTALVSVSRPSRQLDAKATPGETVSEKDVQEPARLAELLGRVVTAVSELRRAWSPKRIDFEDLAVTTAAVPLEHRFAGRVRWWVTDWSPTTPGAAPTFERNSATTSDTLWLKPANAGTVSIRVEEAG